MPELKYLNRLTPAEALLILKGDGVELKELLKFTLTDLFMRDILKFVVEKKERKRKSGNKTRIYKYVLKGPAYSEKRLKDHQYAFLNAFYDQERILLRTLVVYGYGTAESAETFLKSMRESAFFDSCISRGFSHWLGGGFELTDKGVKVKKQLQEELEALKEKLHKLILTNREEAMKLVRQFGALVLLIEGFELPIFKEIEREIEWEIHRDERRASNDSVDWSGY